jgi:hypothetical protein
MAGSHRSIDPVPLWHRIAVTPAEAGALIGRSEEFVRQQIRDGFIVPVPHCENILIATKALRAWADGDLAVVA